MPFSKPLPDWNAPGVQPPQALRDAGYQPNDEPAPQHFNYQFYTTDEALKELQQNAVHKTDYTSYQSTVEQRFTTNETNTANNATAITNLQNQDVSLDARLDVLEAKDEDWSYPTSLMNGWANRTDPTRAMARYRKLQNGLVMVMGDISSGTIGTSVFRLPTGSRPSKSFIVPGRSYNGTMAVICNILVSDSGFIGVIEGSNVEVNLGCITFLAEQ